MYFDNLINKIKYYSRENAIIDFLDAVNMFDLIKYYQWRVQTLLEANNRTLERARKAEVRVKELEADVLALEQYAGIKKYNA